MSKTKEKKWYTVNEFSKAFCLGLFLLGMINYILFWVFTAIGILVDSQILTDSSTQCFGGVIGYLTYQGSLKNSINKYNIDTSKFRG